MTQRSKRPPILNHVLTPHWLELDEIWRRKTLMVWIVMIAAMAMFSLLPNFGPPGVYGFDKIVHAATFFSLALLPHVVFKQRKTVLLAASGLILLGCAIEVAQAFVPGRDGDIWDAAANTAGVLTAVALGARFRQIFGTMTSAAR